MLEKLKKAIKIAAGVATFYAAIFAGKLAYKTYIYDYKGKSVIYALSSPRSGGTGFQVIAPSGEQYTITNRHICKGNDRLYYKDENGNSGVIEVIEISQTHDLCILEPIMSLPALKVASKLYMHEEVHLLGHPRLRPLTWERGYYLGFTYINLVTSCKEKSFHEKKQHQITFAGLRFRYCTINISANMFNTNAYGGNSGSPILDFKGDVIAVLYAGSPSQPDISYAVPLNVLQEFLRDY